MISTSEIKITRPDDAHLHLRDNEMLRLVLPFSSQHFARAVIMPNLNPPICTLEDARAYRQRILAACPTTHSFEPLMTCYLTENLSPEILKEGFHSHLFVAAKLYPAHATTHSAFGVSDVKKIYPLLETLQKIKMPLLIHGESTDPSVDIFDREAVFIENTLIVLRQNFPELKIVLEHITTAEAADFVEAGDEHLAATVTPQHLWFDRNAMLVGGMHVHLYCLPILKAQRHQQALRRLATSGFARIFAGTDSAPHWRAQKESAHAPAGVFNAPSALAVYTEVFEQEQALEHLEAFLSFNAARFYGWPLNADQITLMKEPIRYPEYIGEETQAIVPFLAGQQTQWRVCP